MSCDEVQPQLQALLDGELTPEETAVVEAHLADCMACSEARDEMHAVLEMAKAWHVEGSTVLAAVQQHIDGEELRALKMEMQHLRGEVAALRAEVASLKSQLGKRNTSAGREVSVLSFPYYTGQNVTRPIV